MYIKWFLFKTYNTIPQQSTSHLSFDIRGSLRSVGGGCTSCLRIPGGRVGRLRTRLVVFPVTAPVFTVVSGLLKSLSELRSLVSYGAEFGGILGEGVTGTCETPPRLKVRPGGRRGPVRYRSGVGRGGVGSGIPVCLPGNHIDINITS